MFSHIVLTAFNYQFGESVSSLYVFYKNNEVDVASATYIAIKSLIALYIGFVVFFSIYKRKKAEKSISNFFNNSFFSRSQTKLMYFFIIFGLLFDILLNYLMAGTYSSNNGSDVSYIIRVFSFFLPAGFCLFIANQTISVRKKRIGLICFTFYKIITMFTGVRAYSLICILVVIYVYFVCVKESKISIVKLLALFFLVYLGGGMLVAIRDLRTTSNFSFSSVVNYIVSSKSNFLLDVISENGISLNVVTIVVTNTKMSGTGGQQLFASILSVVPGVSHILDLDFESMILDSALNLRSLGGCYITDVIFDFGELYFFVCILLGIFFAWFYERFEISIKNRDYLTMALLTPIAIELTFCVRSSLSKMPRMALWYITFFFIFYVLSVLLGGQRRHYETRLQKEV